MSRFARCGIFVSVVIAFNVGIAYADTSETKGGLNIKSDDGNYQGSLGGRIHLDTNFIQEDKDAAFGSAGTENDGFFLRRAVLTVKGKVNGWNYKIEPDFAPNAATGASNIAFQDVYISHALGPGEIFVGQLKPFHGMDELTGANDLTLIERPYASAVGVFNGGRNREFQIGLFYKAPLLDRGMFGISGFSLRRGETATTEGFGGNARLSYAPVLGTGRVVHLGASYTLEKPDQLNNEDSATPSGTAGNIGTSVTYAGRRGPAFVLGSTAAFDQAETLGVELAGQIGPLVGQAEYMQQTLGQGTGVQNQSVDVYYVQLSYMVTGEVKAYRYQDGVFGSIKPSKSSGAFEVAARYDHGANADLSTDPKIESITLGGTWYAKSSVRLMMNYILGSAERRTSSGLNQTDEPKTLAMRLQIGF